LKGKNKKVGDAAEKVSVAEMVVGDEWVVGDESDRVAGVEMSGSPLRSLLVSFLPG
jgi:hypothetical protein